MAGGRRALDGSAGAAGGVDPALVGLPGASRLLADLAAAPTAPVQAAVVAPGGAGKSALLAALVRTARRAGVPTRRIRSGDTVPFPADEDVLLLVDDAHLLDDATLAELTDVVDDPDARIVVAARPWPAPRALSVLWLALGRRRAPVALPPLTDAGVTARAEVMLGRPCPPPLTASLARLSGGSPAIVDRLVLQVRESGPGPLLRAGEAWPEELPGVLDLLRNDIRQLEPGTHRLVLALAVGAPLLPAALAEVLDVGQAALGELMDQAAASGLLLAAAPSAPGAPPVALPPIAARVLVRLSAADERLDLERRIAEQALSRGASVLEPAQRLLGAGLRGVELAQVFTAAGDEALHQDPGLAGALYSDAVVAGAPARSVALRRAEAAALAGDLDVALRLADPLTTAEAPEDRARAAVVVAVVMAHRGMGQGAAEVLERSEHTRLLAVPSLLAGGHLARGREVLAADDHRSGSTTVRSALVLVADGLLASLSPSADGASVGITALTHAVALFEPLGRAVLLPDSPAALAATVALHAGELDLADSILLRAEETRPGGPVMVPRHRLLRAWISMLRGDAATARELIASAADGRLLEPRDDLVAAAIEVGIARRTGDSVLLRTTWTRARKALLHHPVDLFTLLPLGELVAGAARLREQSALRASWAAAEHLVAALGHPPVWCTTTRWYSFVASATARDETAARVHLDALLDLAEAATSASVFAPAAAAWLAALTGDVDVEAVQTAAAGLHRHGWTWDAARLLSEAAMRTHDRRAMTVLLARARSLADLGRAASDGSGPAASIASPAGLLSDDGATVTLSEREQEVAGLMLAGLTQKQIGARLYISIKTVEHHVARMRQRLGATSRTELFARLRDVLESPGAPERSRS